MKNIKFSKEYCKLWGQTTAKLLAVKEVKINKSTSQELIEYDTKAVDGSYYELKSGNYLLLIFLGNLDIPFSTIRSAYPQHKVDYYKNSINEMFNIERIF